MECCLFKKSVLKVCDIQFETLENFGSSYNDETGTVIHWLHTWDEGYRSLIRCKNCGALFLCQHSEFHGQEDAYYNNLFPVESREIALVLNSTFDGFAIERDFQGAWLCETRTGWGITNQKRSI